MNAEVNAVMVDEKDMKHEGVYLNQEQFWKWRALTFKSKLFQKQFEIDEVKIKLRETENNYEKYRIDVARDALSNRRSMLVSVDQEVEKFMKDLKEKDGIDLDGKGINEYTLEVITLPKP
jgi:hypothetical protein